MGMVVVMGMPVIVCVLVVMPMIVVMIMMFMKMMIMVMMMMVVAGLVLMARGRSFFSGWFPDLNAVLRTAATAGTAHNNPFYFSNIGINAQSEPEKC